MICAEIFTFFFFCPAGLFYPRNFITFTNIHTTHIMYTFRNIYRMRFLFITQVSFIGCRHRRIIIIYDTRKSKILCMRRAVR